MISDIKIGARLALGFSLVLTCAGLLVAAGLWGMTELQTGTERIVNEKVASLTEATDMREAGWALTLSLRKVAAPTDAAEGAREAKKLAQILEQYAKSEQALGKLIGSAQGKAVLAAATEQKKTLFPIVGNIKEQAAGGNYFDAASMLKSDFLPLHEKWMENLGALAEHQQREMKSTYEASRRQYKTTRTGIFAVGLLTLALGAFIAWFITRTITVPLRHAGRIADTIARGDLTGRIEATTHDEAGQLVTSLKKMQANLLDTVNRIKHGTETISVASDEIASGNLDLSNRTESQADSLEQTAASMEQFTATVKQNAENAHQVNRLIASASELASQGGMVMAEVVETMGSIMDGSRKIVDITGVIDSIAFQTNILALNAAVEAARAGPNGRGFAVVATEVRNLAQRSAEAAKQIKSLIGNSVQRVEAGGKLVDRAGHTMNEIVTSVTYVAGFMDDITTASQEQSAGIELVNRAIEKIDTMTQQNAALVEQAAAAAESLQEQTIELGRAVSVFKLNDDAPAVQVRPAAPAEPQVAPHRSLALASTGPDRAVSAHFKRHEVTHLAVGNGGAWEEL